MKPFLSYFGGKYKVSELLKPKCELVIEPFAGAAGFSVRREPRKVILIDLDPVVIGVWRYIQRASPRDIERLPGRIMHVDDLPSWLCQEERWLIGFWQNHGLSTPGRSLCNYGRQSAYANNYWGEFIKRRIIAQQDQIRDWQIIEGNYWDAPDVCAHWHVDPPYRGAGRSYRFHHIDYEALAQWCLTRQGFVQVFEGGPEDWLPFRPFVMHRTHRPTEFSQEWIFEQDNRVR